MLKLFRLWIWFVIRSRLDDLVHINSNTGCPHLKLPWAFLFNADSAQCATDLEHLYRIYSIPTHDKHQWLLLQFVVLLMTDAKGVQNM